MADGGGCPSDEGQISRPPIDRGGHLVLEGGRSDTCQREVSLGAPWWARRQEAPSPPAVLRAVLRRAHFGTPVPRRLWRLADLLKTKPR